MSYFTVLDVLYVTMGTQNEGDEKSSCMFKPSMTEARQAGAWILKARQRGLGRVRPDL